MAEVLLEIAQNASIRGMRVDGVELFSVLDFIAYVCPGRTSNNVKVMWHRLENEISSDVVTKCNYLKFNGKGQRNTPCMTILGLQKLLLILGSKAAVEFRDRVLECFNRVLSGDCTLIREITANAARGGPVQQIARAALAEQAAEDRAAIEDARPNGERMELELTDRKLDLKRKAEDWELQVAERRIELVERQMTLEQRQIEQQMTLPLTVQKQKLELACSWVACMQQINPDWRADARLQLQAQDRLCNAFLIEPRLAIAGPTQGAAAPRLECASLTIKAVADSLRAEFRGRADDGALLRAGRTAAQMYAERHDMPPGKHAEMHNGRVMQVNSYTEGDRGLLEEAVRRTMTAGGRPLTEFFAPRS
jgi:hypothetical protein